MKSVSSDIELLEGNPQKMIRGKDVHVSQGAVKYVSAAENFQTPKKFKAKTKIKKIYCAAQPSKRKIGVKV